MSHSLRAKLRVLRYKGILEDKDYKRLCHALDLEKAEQEPCRVKNELNVELNELEPCDDVVSRQAVLDCATLITSIPTEDWDIGDWVCLFRDRVSQLPPVNPQEPKTGQWIAIDEEPHEDYECDKCGYVCSAFTANIKPSDEYKHCPNCGAKMVEPQERSDKE